MTVGQYSVKTFLMDKMMSQMQRGLVDFGDVYDIRLENVSGRLNRHVHRTNNLKHAIQVSPHNERLMRGYEIHSNHQYGRRELRVGYSYLLRVVSQMTARSAILTAGVCEVDYQITANAAVPGPVHYVDVMSRCFHQNSCSVKLVCGIRKLERLPITLVSASNE
ncbi:hypothetical protein CLF_103039 [Clonorchis sinensis]|uniref:Uncharacterized protein n=1 Tax=Clonorchis sinensis TaxID=79923 RepID=G7Y8Y5_CLOSI|nr:hypothetical protein CLF_103039 [Clonorchis sinensis]